MATVWRARDTRLDRTVALKRPHPAPPGDPVHARLEREARAAASLNHPHLVTIFDVGRDETGPYIVMELVEGATLAEAGPELDRPESLRVIAQVADALAVVHAAGVVHRDIKPANVLMSDRGPQLTDFGIAVAGDSTSQLTRDGSLVATPSYASPEQLEGRPATAKSDIFSLGVVLYELVTGRLPFVDTQRPHPPAPVGNPALDALLARAMSPEPNDRPEAAELASSLRSVAPTTTFPLGGGSTVPMAVPSPAPEPATAEPDSAGRPIPLLMAGVGLAALIALAATIITTPDDTPDVPAPSVPATTSPNTAPPTTLPATTSTPVTTTTTTTPPTTTIPGTSAAVEDARDNLEASLSAAHASDLNPNEVRELMEKADDAIAAVGDDKEKEADKKLREIAREIDDKLEGDVRHRSLESLVALAEALDISLQQEGNRDDDDDDEND